MKKRYLLIAAALFSITVKGQEEIINSWSFNPDSTKAVQEEQNGSFSSTSTIADVTEVCYTTDYVFVKTSGVPDTIGFYTNPGNAVDQSLVWKFPRNAVEQVNTKTDVPDIFGNGVLINGIPIFGNGDGSSWSGMQQANANNGDGIWNGEAWYGESESLDDRYAAHPQSDGMYHTHATPFVLYDFDASEHSPIVGWSYDGYPIYGPFGYTDSMDANSSIKRMVSGFEIRSDMTQRKRLPNTSNDLPPQQWGPDVSVDNPLGEYIEDYEFTDNGDLDEHNGRWCVTPEFPNGTYAYFVTTDENGDAAYPYYLGTSYYGVVAEENFDVVSTAISVPNEATCVSSPVLNTSVIPNLYQEVGVYPNPTDSYVSISFEKAPNAIKIFDLVGNERIEVSVGEASSVDVSVLESGVYLLSLEYSNSTTTKRFVVK